MKDEALRIIQIIDSCNESIHEESIDRMIQNFHFRWANDNNSSIELDELIFQLSEAVNRFLTRIDTDDSIHLNLQIKNMQKTITPQIHLQLSFGDEPFVIRFIPSGWSSPRTYHVIREYGDMEQSDYVGLMDANQIKERYGFEADLESVEDFSLPAQVRNNPNDQTLGRVIRNHVNNLIKTI
jgi:hypothetical protein